MAVLEKAEAPYEHLKPYDVGPRTIPVEAPDEVVGDCYLEMLTLSNPTDNAITVTLWDRTAVSPLQLANIELAAGEPWSWDYKGLRCKNGLAWKADVEGAIGYARIRA